MNEDYLWDRSGEPDGEIARLEALLTPLRWQAPPAKRTNRWWMWAAAAAVVPFFIAGVTYRLQQGQPTAWHVTIAGQESAMRTNQWIDTRNGQAATLESDGVGEVRVEPNSRLRLQSTSADQQRFSLESGSIHAFIWARPTQFVVDTPAAKTVDLGCRYTLTVAPDGSGEVKVTMGWVAFEWAGRESFVPAGAICRTRVGFGPGTPVRVGASREFADAVDHFDRNPNSNALDRALKSATNEDAFTLWHLLNRTQGAQREQVWDAFAARTTLPPQVTRAVILHNDRTAFDAAWNALELGDIKWWREWKRPPVTK